MSFFSKLFGRKTPPAVPPPLPPSAPAPSPPPSDPAKDPNMIRVFDSYGREMFITKQQWRDNVLLGHIQKVWDNAEQLSSVIIQALQDGFGADMVKPAERLTAIDPDTERGAVILAIVYREQKRLDDSENVLRRHIARHGESGVVLTNLAKIHADRGQNDEMLRTLWRGLELDPNQDNGLGWYEVLHREKDGPAAGVAALRRIAALPGSWRARMWLARDALTRRQLDEALALYEEALSFAPRPTPTDLLQQLSGDLGNHGHLPELLRLTAPHFQVEVHGLAVGNNLIKANLDLGRLDAARALLNQHYAQKRPDWKETLSFWDTELAKTHVAITSAPSDGKFSVVMLVDNGPVWLPDRSPAAELFPPPTATPIRVAFLGSSAETNSQEDKPVHQLSDLPGRVCRALPLFLAEQVRFHGSADVRTITPWLKAEACGFVVSGVPWKDDEATQHARSGDLPADYLVLTHLKAAADLWRVELRLIRTIDARCLGTAEAAFPMAQPEDAVRQLARDLLRLLMRHADLDATAPTAFYRVPSGADFGHYLGSLEQLLAVRCAGMDDTPAGFLHGERAMTDENLQLCLKHPDNVVTRLLLAQTLRGLQKVRPDVVAEFKDKVALLQKEKPLPEPAQSLVQQTLNEALTTP